MQAAYLREQAPARWRLPSCRVDPSHDRDHDAILLAAPTFVFVGTVLRMWDSIAEADKDAEFLPRTSIEEIRHLFRFFTMLDRVEHAVAPDRYLYYLRTAQGWFFLAVGSFGALVLSIGHVLFA
jgi:hypothetical protein